jgi:hypothetical protein
MLLSVTAALCLAAADCDCLLLLLICLPTLRLSHCMLESKPFDNYCHTPWRCCLAQWCPCIAYARIAASIDSRGQTDYWWSGGKRATALQCCLWMCLSIPLPVLTNARILPHGFRSTTRAWHTWLPCFCRSIRSLIFVMAHHVCAWRSSRLRLHGASGPI